MPKPPVGLPTLLVAAAAAFALGVALPPSRAQAPASGPTAATDAPPGAQGPPRPAPALGQALAPAQAQDAETEPADPARGEYLVRAANCAACHTDTTAKSAPFAGGRALPGRLGVFYAPNLTPDPTTGLGGWDQQDFHRAMRDGLSPHGQAYYPSFPYPAFTGIADDDLRDMWAYLSTLPPVVHVNRPHQLRLGAGWRWPLRLWQLFYFRRGPLAPDTARPAEWNRGAYLVRAVANCGECHTPRSAVGAPRADMALAGTADGADGQPAPNITPDRDTGIGLWDDTAIAYYLETGLRPDGKSARGAMAQVIEASTAHLTPQDRHAIATYLKWLPPVPHKVGPS